MYEATTPEDDTRRALRRVKATIRAKKARAVQEHILMRSGDVEAQQAQILASRKAFTQAEARKAPQALTDWLNDE